LTEHMEASLPKGINKTTYIHKTKAGTTSQIEDAQTLLKEQHSSATNKETRSIIHKQGER
jgi:hypothetical protein